MAKIDDEQEFLDSELKVNEYMNYFSLGFGLDQTLKTTADGESEKDKPGMSGSYRFVSDHPDCSRCITT